MPLPKKSYPWKHWFRQKLRRLRAQRQRNRLKNTRVVAITGSCGKTSATQFIAKILSDHQPCQLGIGDNCENSIYKNLIHCQARSRFFVQEVSGHEPGHLQLTLEALKHHIGVVTTVGLDHYTAYRRIEAVAAEKATMIRMLPNDGCAILNADNPHVAAMASLTKARVITFGICEKATIRATDLRCDWPDLLSLTVHHQGQSARLETRLFGSILLPSLLAAVAVGVACGLSLQSCAQSLTNIESRRMRMSIHRARNGTWFINDAGKAPFWSVTQCMDQFRKAKAPRKTLIFGSMSDTPGSESGKYRRMARYALGIFDRIIFTGRKAIHIAKLPLEQTQGRIHHTESIEEAAGWIQQDPIDGELIYLKSSQDEHLERIRLSLDHQLNCRLIRCPKTIDCSECPESGCTPVG